LCGLVRVLCCFCLFCFFAVQYSTKIVHRPYMILVYKDSME